jgi:hypothetical protein
MNIQFVLIQTKYQYNMSIFYPTYLTGKNMLYRFMLQEITPFDIKVTVHSDVHGS